MDLQSCVFHAEQIMLFLHGFCLLHGGLALPEGEHSTMPFVFPSRTAGRVRGSGLSWTALKACLPSWPTHSVGRRVYDGRATWAKASAGGSRGCGPLRKRARIHPRQPAIGEALHLLHAFMRMLMHFGVVHCSDSVVRDNLRCDPVFLCLLQAGR